MFVVTTPYINVDINRIMPVGSKRCGISKLIRNGIELIKTNISPVAKRVSDIIILYFIIAMFCLKNQPLVPPDLSILFFAECF